MTSNLGSFVTIEDIPRISKTTLPKIITPKNTILGFYGSGIVPYNRQIFIEDECLPIFVIDIPLPANEDILITGTIIDAHSSCSDPSTSIPTV